MDSRIQTIHAREILDSRGNPTVGVDVTWAAALKGVPPFPLGASTGVHEAVELRDQDPHRYAGKGVRQAVSHVNGALAAATQGLDALDQGIRVASRNFLTICLTRFLTFWVAFRVTAHVLG